MLGKFNCSFGGIRYDENGNAEIYFSIPSKNKWSMQQVVKSLKESIANSKDMFTVSVDIYKNKRSLDQNSMMWALLTEYADGMNAGKKGGVTPEQLYYQSLSKYGVAEYLLTIDEAEEMLSRSFKFVERIDKRKVNDKWLTMFKCYYGSSTYDTKQMSELIDGILDELAQAGIDTVETRYIAEEWQNAKSVAKKERVLQMQNNAISPNAPHHARYSK